MRAMVDAKEFSQALDKVSKTARRSSIPVLEGVLVEIANGRCTLTATDLTTWLTAEFPARGDDLSFVLQRTKDAVRACRHFEGELALELSEAGEGRRRRLWLTLSCGPREAKIAVIIPEEFPCMGTDEYGRTFTANAARLLERTQRVKYTLRTSDPNEKPVRCQVQFRDADVYALDGHRLACDTDPELPVPIPFMAPPDALEHLKFFGEQEVSLSFGQRYLRITDGFFTIYTRFNLADIFDLNSAVPKQFTEEFQVNTQEFLRELAYLKEFAPSSGRLTVTISEVDEVKAQEVVYLKPRKRSRSWLLLVSVLRSFWTSLTVRPTKNTVMDADFTPVDEPKEDDNDEELNRIVGMFKLARESGYTLKLIPGAPEENAPVFNKETGKIIRPAA